MGKPSIFPVAFDILARKKQTQYANITFGIKENFVGLCGLRNMKKKHITHNFNQNIKNSGK